MVYIGIMEKKMETTTMGDIGEENGSYYLGFRAELKEIDGS